MGTPRLRPLFPSKFTTWVKRVGYQDEFEFWSSLSGIQSTSVVDHMVAALKSLGYLDRSPNDQFRRFLRDQVGLLNMTPAHIGTLFDEVNEFFDQTFVVSNPSTPIGVKMVELFPYPGFINAGVYQ